MSQISYIIIYIDQQRMLCFDHSEKKIRDYPVSTSIYGTGCQNGSFKTPLGKHSIAQKIGAGCDINEVFSGRQPQGNLGELMNAGKALPDDIITSRILWLQGEESAMNKGEDSQGELVDSYQRYIYIHGTPEENKIGSPASHGCVRMCNKDVIELFDQVDVACKVLIQEKKNE